MGAVHDPPSSFLYTNYSYITHIPLRSFLEKRVCTVSLCIGTCTNAEMWYNGLMDLNYVEDEFVRTYPAIGASNMVAVYSAGPFRVWHSPTCQANHIPASAHLVEIIWSHGDIGSARLICSKRTRSRPSAVVNALKAQASELSGSANPGLLVEALMLLEEAEGRGGIREVLDDKIVDAASRLSREIDKLTFATALELLMVIGLEAT